MGKAPKSKDILVVGAGVFGKRALELLGERVQAVADTAPQPGLAARGWEVWAMDGAAAVNKALSPKKGINWIVPAVPVHLAAQWLKFSLEENTFKPLDIKEKDLPPADWKMAGGRGIWYLSLADFRCPVDCPEPAVDCTVTGKPRGVPMYERIRRQSWPGLQCLVLRSRQLAPGVGALEIKDLKGMREAVKGRAGGWVLATACKCHAVVEGLENSPVQK